MASTVALSVGAATNLAVNQNYSPDSVSHLPGYLFLVAFRIAYSLQIRPICIMIRPIFDDLASLWNY